MTHHQPMKRHFSLKTIFDFFGPQTRALQTVKTNGNLLRYCTMLLGPLLCLLIVLYMPDSYTLADGTQDQLSFAGRACLGVLVWMAIWWCFETVPISVTSLLPMVLFPALHVCKPSVAMAPYASDTVFLFMGAFLLAGGVTRWGLDRRIALFVMNGVGTTPRRLTLGIMLTTTVLSAFMSNTATAAMMVPVAVAVISLVHSTSDLTDPNAVKREHNFSICLLLALAYGASIGGMATLIGSPPNGIYMRFMDLTYHQQVSVVDWMRVGVPVAVILFVIAYLFLTLVLFRDMGGEVPGGKEWVRREFKSLGKLSNGEIAVGSCFLIAAILWFTGGSIRSFVINDTQPFKWISDSVIAMGMGTIMFLIPVDRKGTPAMTWEVANQAISWDVLLLFGGGLSLAAAIQSTGVAQLIGAQVSIFSDAPFSVLLLGVVTLVTFATGVTSNTALAAMMMPLLAAVCEALNLPAQSVLLGTALAASAAFILPISTPPNAIVFGTGKIRIIDMLRAGLMINILAILVITGVILIMM